MDQLERQTEILYDIASKYKRRAEEEQQRMTMKIKHLERQNQQLLMSQKNEDKLNHRTYNKINALKQLGFYMNPYIATVDPMYIPQIAQNLNVQQQKENSSDDEDDDDDDEEESDSNSNSN